MTNKSVKSVCPYCGVGCGIVMEVANNRIIKVTGDKTHPANFGRLCTKGNTCNQAINESGRLEHAYIRTDRQHEPVRIDIELAIQETATRLTDILKAHGPDAVAFYVSGQMSLEAQYLANKLAKGFIGTKNIESNSRLCMASASSGYKLSLGSDAPPGSYQDFDHADVFFVIGANMADCHPILFLRMMDRVKAGAKLIVVDPRRNVTADKADLFLQINPGTDLALINGLLHLLIENGQTDLDFISEFTEDWDVMPEFLEGYAPKNVSEITGLPEADIRKAAEWIGTAANWMSCWTMGLNQSTHGTWNTNAICNLHIATGAICSTGSGPFSLTGQPNAMGGREVGYMGGGLPGQRSVLDKKDRNFIEDLWGLEKSTLRTDVGGGTVALFEDMQKNLIKACWIICTNPVATVPNRENVIAGLQAAELVITQDAFLDTETNRYADILLPGALWAEAEGVMVNSERNLTLMQKAVEPSGEAMPDWQIIARVACEMGYTQAFSYDSASQIFDEIKQAWNPETGYDIRGASYERLRETPLQWPCASGDSSVRNPLRYLNNGVNQPFKINKDGSKPRIVFATKNGKAVFWARPYLPPAELPDDEFQFVLNTGRLQHQWHTMTKTRSIATLNKLNPEPYIEIHPEDAVALSIDNKDLVEVRSRRGRAVLPAMVTNRVRPGNCFAPFHWNDVFGDKLAINAVTNDAVDPISQQPEFKYCAISLTRVENIQVIQQTINESKGILVNAIAGPTIASINIDKMPQINAMAKFLGLDKASSIVLDDNEHRYMQGYLAGLSNQGTSGGVPVIPLNAPLETSKRLYVDGLLAGLFARAWMPNPGTEVSPQSTNDKYPSITIIWASQTGNAENFANRCAERFKTGGYKVNLSCMDAFNVKDLLKVTRLLVMTSTFGDGDPPDNGIDFWNTLQNENTLNLNQLEFAVLAFGDSNYGQFCGFGKKLDERLEALGGKRLVARVDCEPDYEESAETWLESIFKSLAKSTANINQPVSVVCDDDKAFEKKSISTQFNSRNQPQQARLIFNQRLNAVDAEKETRQIVFDLSETNLVYEAGDAVGVWPTNCPDLVDEMLTILKLPANTLVSVKNQGELPIAEALLCHYEITKITSDILKFVSNNSGSEMLAKLMAEDKKCDLQQWLWGKQIVDLLQAFPIDVKAEDWLTSLKLLQPRLYSISSSPKIYPKQIDLTVSTVRYKNGEKPRGGVCSTFLADRAEHSPVPIYIHKSPHFRVPKEFDAPMIMVGPGTGIAPFRAFLQERQAIGAKGKNWLFFGEQKASKDFYYRDELKNMQHQGGLHRFSTAFSRDQSEKIYVQHRMIEHGAELWTWLQEGAYFYVCGDASRMAKDVDTALRQIVQKHGSMSEDNAIDYVRKMMQDKRYLRDIY